MDAKSTYLENAVLNHVLRNVALSSPAAVYLALYTVAPTDAGGGTEVTGGSYARQVLTFGAPASGVTTNSGVVTFPTATAGWGSIVAAGIFDAVSGGNLLYYGDLAVAKTISTNDTISFPIAGISVTEQ